MFNILNLQNKNILLVGIGGGFDICAGLPLLHSLKSNNKVIKQNILIELLENTKSFDDVIHLYMKWKNNQNTIL